MSPRGGAAASGGPKANSDHYIWDSEADCDAMVEARANKEAVKRAREKVYGEYVANLRVTTYEHTPADLHADISKDPAPGSRSVHIP